MTNMEFVLSPLNSEFTKDQSTPANSVSLKDKFNQLHIQSELVVWLIGPRVNKTLHSPYGRRFIKDLLEMVADSDAVLVLQGSDEFFTLVKSAFSNHKLVEIRKNVNVLVCRNKFTSYSPMIRNERTKVPTEMFHCAFVFDGPDVDYNSVIKNLPQKMQVTVIKDLNHTFSEANDLDLEKEYTKRSFSVAKKIFQDLKHFWEDKLKNEKFLQSQWSIVQNLFLLGIHLNQFDEICNTNFNEMFGPKSNANDKQWLKQAAFLAMRLYRQNVLTHLCQNGINLMTLVDENFICTLFHKEPWQDPNERQSTKFDDIRRKVFKLIRSLAGKHFYESSEASFDMADLLFIDSVFEMKLEASLLYWTLVRHPVHAALIAYGVSKMLKKTNQGNVTTLKENMTTYRKLLIEAVNNSYYKSRRETFKMLKQNIPEWGRASCIQIAIATSNKKFLSEAPLINARECIWNGKKVEESNFSKIVNMKETILIKLKAPVTKFTYNLIFYTIFLGLYGILLLSKLESDTYHWLEWVLWAWIGTFTFHLVHSWITGSYRLDDVFSLLELFSLLFFLLAFGLRVAAKEIPDSHVVMETARVVYSLDYILFTIRLLKYCYGSQFLGPLVAMIFGMTSTLVQFLVILLIIFLAYVISSESVLNPNSELNWNLLYFVSRKAYWSMFGDYHLDELENIDGTNESCTSSRQSYNEYLGAKCLSGVGRYFVPIILGVFVMVVNLMLFNLIIAKFNSVITDIEERSFHIWNHQMFQLVIEYDNVLILQPPLFILPLILYMLSCKKCFNNRVSNAPSDCGEVFEKDVVLYLKQQIDDGRFFKRLDAYKKSGRQNFNTLLSAFQDTTDELNSVIADQIRHRDDTVRWQTESITELGDMQNKISEIKRMVDSVVKKINTLLSSRNLNVDQSLNESDLMKDQNDIKNLQLSVDKLSTLSSQQEQKLSDRFIKLEAQIRALDMKIADNKVSFEKILQAACDIAIDVDDLKDKQAKKDKDLEIMNRNIKTMKVRQKKNDRGLLDKLEILQEEKPGKEEIEKMIQTRSEKTEKLLQNLIGLTQRILNKERFQGGESV